MNNIEVPEVIESVPPASSNDSVAGASAAASAGAAGSAADDYDEDQVDEARSSTDSNEDNTSDIDRTPYDCDNVENNNSDSGVPFIYLVIIQLSKYYSRKLGLFPCFALVVQIGTFSFFLK